MSTGYSKVPVWYHAYSTNINMEGYTPDMHESLVMPTKLANCSYEMPFLHTQFAAHRPVETTSDLPQYYIKAMLCECAYQSTWVGQVICEEWLSVEDYMSPIFDMSVGFVHVLQTRCGQSYSCTRRVWILLVCLLPVVDIVQTLTMPYSLFTILNKSNTQNSNSLRSQDAEADYSIGNF